MSANDHSNNQETDRSTQAIQSALFAHDLKKLVRASAENDTESVTKIRNFHEPDTEAPDQ